MAFTARTEGDKRKANGPRRLRHHRQRLRGRPSRPRTPGGAGGQPDRGGVADPGQGPQVRRRSGHSPRLRGLAGAAGPPRHPAGLAGAAQRHARRGGHRRGPRRQAHRVREAAVPDAGRGRSHDRRLPDGGGASVLRRGAAVRAQIRAGQDAWSTRAPWASRSWSSSARSTTAPTCPGSGTWSARAAACCWTWAATRSNSAAGCWASRRSRASTPRWAPTCTGTRPRGEDHSLVIVEFEGGGDGAGREQLGQAGRRGRPLRDLRHRPGSPGPTCCAVRRC